MDGQKTKLTVKCPFCGNEQEIEVSTKGLEDYRNGALIQHAFPELDANMRELIMTGICNDCFTHDDSED